MRVFSKNLQNPSTFEKVMSLLGSEEPKESPINYLERPEFLGDAVLGFVCSVSLFFLFPNLGEGALSMLRCALGFQGFSIS